MWQSTGLILDKRYDAKLKHAKLRTDGSYSGGVGGSCMTFSCCKPFSVIEEYVHAEVHHDQCGGSAVRVAEHAATTLIRLTGGESRGLGGAQTPHGCS